jgi:hypothetical protein
MEYPSPYYRVPLIKLLAAAAARPVKQMELWSYDFLDESRRDPFKASCIMYSADWRRVVEGHPASKRIIAQIETDGGTFYLPLGSPIHDTSPSDIPQLFLPTWVLDSLGVSGSGDDATVSWVSEETFPPATSITLRPHDSAFYTTDIKAELEVALGRIAILRRGDTILIPLDALGGYAIGFDIVHTEPAAVVLADGDEVAIEFEAALDRPPTPEPEPVPEPAEEPPVDFSTMIPAAAAPEPQGRRLGGTTRPPLADGRPWNPYRD